MLWGQFGSKLAAHCQLSLVTLWLIKLVVESLYCWPLAISSVWLEGTCSDVTAHD